MEFEILRGICEERHFHPHVELLFVLEGTLTADVQGSRFTLEKEGVAVVNASMYHEILCSPDTVLCRVNYSYSLLMRMMEGENCIFFCNSAHSPNRSYGEIRRIIRDLVYQHVHGSRQTKCLQDSLLLQLLDELIENYRFSGTVETQGGEKDGRISRIIHYINKNYQSGISLSELADQMYVSASTLSRIFHRETGIYFADYVNQVRMKYALSELLYTNKNITRIAMDCGFSNPSGFNKVFRETYGQPPTEYRNVLRERALREARKEEQLKEELRRELKKRDPDAGRLSAENRVSVKADAGKGVPCRKPWSTCINIGALSSLTLANLQYHTVYLTEKLGFQYVRLWNVFSRKLMITDGKTIGNYNYDNLNVVFDFLTSHNIRPYLDFGKRPNTLLGTEEKSLYFEEEFIEFSSRRAWEALLEDFLRHVIRRYGREEVENWIFEFSCNRVLMEDSDYYQDEEYDYFQAYFYAYHLIRQYLPGAKVGGFSGVIHWEYDFVKQFLLSCRNYSCLPDFISFFLFPYETRMGSFKRIADEHFERQEIENIRRVLEETQITREQCGIYLTEWNCSLSGRNFINDSCFRAAYFARGAAAAGDSVDMMCTWMGSDWVSSYYDSIGVINGGNGLLTKDSIRKPAYYALEFLNKLGAKLLQKGRNYIITQNGDCEFYILCFYFMWYNGSYFLKEEDQIQPEDLDEIFGHSAPITLDITLGNLGEEGEYIVKKRRVNREYGSILDQWRMFDCPRSLDSGDVKYLREICIPHLELTRQKAENGQLRIETELKEHEICLIHVYHGNLKG